jgi:hypothetical protein
VSTESIQVTSTQWWEISYPVPGIFELFDFLFWDVHHSQQIVLELYFLFILWECWWIAVQFELVCQLNGSRANWHSCAMETEWEQNVVSVKSFIPGVEITFGH